MTRRPKHTAQDTALRLLAQWVLAPSADAQDARALIRAASQAGMATALDPHLPHLPSPQDDPAVWAEALGEAILSSEKGGDETLRWLLGRGADPHRKLGLEFDPRARGDPTHGAPHQDLSALDLAIWYGRNTAVLLLVTEGRGTWTPNSWANALGTAAFRNRRALFQRLWDLSPLPEAERSGFLKHHRWKGFSRQPLSLLDRAVAGNISAIPTWVELLHRRGVVSPDAADHALRRVLNRAHADPRSTGWVPALQALERVGIDWAQPAADAAFLPPSRDPQEMALAGLLCPPEDTLAHLAQQLAPGSPLNRFHAERHAQAQRDRLDGTVSGPSSAARRHRF